MSCPREESICTVGVHLASVLRAARIARVGVDRSSANRDADRIKLMGVDALARESSRVFFVVPPDPVEVGGAGRIGACIAESLP